MTTAEPTATRPGHPPDRIPVARVMNPRSVAIIGASANDAKFGSKILECLVHQKFGGAIYPINPSAETLRGLKAYPSIADVPARPQLVSVYLPPAVLLKVLPAIAAKGCDELWLNPGTESPEVLAEAERLGLNVIQACSIVGVGVSPATL